MVYWVNGQVLVRVHDSNRFIPGFTGSSSNSNSGSGSGSGSGRFANARRNLIGDKILPSSRRGFQSANGDRRAVEVMTVFTSGSEEEMLAADRDNSWVVECYQSYGGRVLQTWSLRKAVKTSSVGVQTDEPGSFDERLREQESKPYWEMGPEPEAGVRNKTWSPESDSESEWEALAGEGFGVINII